MQDQAETALFSQVLKSEDTNLYMAKLPYQVSTVGLSDMGLVRQNNEDVWAQVPTMGLYLLADGMGGHQAGEVAAREAVSSLCKVLKKKFVPSKKYTLHEMQEFLKRAIVHVNSVVFKMGRSKQEWRGMGTTLCCLLFHEEGLIYAHVGDSRIYRLRNDHFEQLTKDHSLLRDLVDQGQINDSQVTDFIYKNIITKAIGTEPKVDPTVKSTHIHAGDTYLMCTDGLSDLLSAKEIASILKESISKEAAVETLVKRANAEGGKDNITVVIVKIVGTDESKDLSR
jgi:PPM family protein phosphatase